HAQELQGTERARATYERIVREFGSQTATVAEARRRLAALKGSGATGMPSKRRLCEECGDGEANLSPDGRWMAMSEWEVSGDLVVKDMATGQMKRLMVKPNTWKESDAYVESPVFSPDLRQIVYTWDSNVDGQPAQLWISPNEVGGKPRVLLNTP